MTVRELFPTLWERDEKYPSSMRTFRNEMERMFEDFSRNLRMPELAGGAMGKGELAPDMDVIDGNKEVTLSVELPGVKQEDIDISVSGHTVSISGEKKSESEVKNGNFYRSERSYGSFHRSIALPFNIDASQVTAKNVDGVLKITVPKPAEAMQQTTKIAIGDKTQG